MIVHSDTVRTERHGRVRAIVVDNPPVNAIAAALGELCGDPESV